MKQCLVFCPYSNINEKFPTISVLSECKAEDARISNAVPVGHEVTININCDQDQTPISVFDVEIYTYGLDKYFNFEHDQKGPAVTLTVKASLTDVIESFHVDININTTLLFYLFYLCSLNCNYLKNTRACIHTLLFI